MSARPPRPTTSMLKPVVGNLLVPTDPEESPRVSPVPTKAGGWGSVAATVAYSVPESGVVRTVGTLARVNQTTGFDCPGCAWPEPEDRSFAEFCENGAKHVADEATHKVVDAAFFARHSVEELQTRSDMWLNKQGRLVEPMALRPGGHHYEPISWEKAFALLGDALSGLSSPHRAVFYTSGRTSNEAAFLYQAFARAYGTNNLPDCSNMCHESSGWALRDAVGVGKGTVTLEDFDAAEVIVVIGQNPGTNHPRMLSALQTAARRGARIVAVNPIREAGLIGFVHPKEVWNYPGRGTQLATHYLQVRIGGDAALFKAIGRFIVDAEDQAQDAGIDRSFVQTHTAGYLAYRSHLQELLFPDLCREAGLSETAVREVAELIRASKHVIYCWAMGLTQHVHATDTIQEVINVALLRGHVGRPGAGLCPVRGHSNVQGDRTMGINEKPSETFLAGVDAALGIVSPREHGYDTVEAIRAMAEGAVDVFVALGGNFLSAAPDTAFTADALRRCRVTAHIATKLNRSHLVTGQVGLILPCLGRTEIDQQASGPQFVTVEDSMSMVHASRGHLPPASPHLLSEPAIVARLAVATLKERTAIPWMELVADYRRIRERITAAIPGFERFEERLEAPRGFRLPNDAGDRLWRTRAGKAEFRVHPLPSLTRAEGELRLMTIRSHDQFNTTVYGLDDRYRGVRRGRHVLFVNPADIEAAGLQAGQKVDAFCDAGGVRRVVTGLMLIPYDIPRGDVAGYFPELNPLVPITEVARNSGTPISKSVPIRIRRSAR